MPSPLPPSVREVCAGQHGVISRSQLIGLGVSDRVIARLVRSGQLRRIHAGAFVDAEIWQQANDETRHMMRLIGVQLRAPDAAAHARTAALFWQLPVRRIPARPIVIRDRDAPQLVHATLRRSKAVGPHVTTHAGVRVTTLAKTVVDVAAEAPFADALITVDAALRRGLPLDNLLTTLNDAPPIHRGRQALRAIEAGDPYSESWLESLSRGRMIERGLDLPLSNVVLRSGHRWARVDHLLLELGVVGEADGVGKYGRPGGPLAVVVRERGRQAWIEDLGLEVARWGTPEVAGNGAGMQQRIDRAVARQSATGFTWPAAVHAEVPLLGAVVPPPHVVREVARLAALGYPICFTDASGAEVPLDGWAA